MSKLHRASWTRWMTIDRQNPPKLPVRQLPNLGARFPRDFTPGILCPQA